jgi:undecaprenyl diphosphate synthase
MIPKTIGVILDGNRRWARSRGLSSSAGHTEGYKVFKQFLGWTRDVGVETVIAYIFSEENWKRTEEEVSFLISLIGKLVDDEFAEISKNNARIIFAGKTDAFPQAIFDKMKKIEEKTKDGVFTLVLCMSYGGRQEIVHAVNSLLKERETLGTTLQPVLPEDISRFLYTKDVSDPDLIIRTSGEMRLSGFLLWQCAYSELFFTQTLWPDFSQKEFLDIIDQFSARERRLGK